MSEGQQPAGWYPDPSDELLLRWWDGCQWTAACMAWQVDALGPPHGYKPTTWSGWLSLWSQRHPFFYGLAIFGVMFVGLGFVEFVMHPSMWVFPLLFATSQGLLWGMVAWRSRRRIRRQHQAFWSGG